MTIRLIDPNESVTINGVPINAWQLAEARQELSHRGVHNPRWAELSKHDQDMAALSAGGWLRALVDLVPTAGPAGDYTCDGCQAQADHWDEDGAPRCERCRVHQQATALEPTTSACDGCGHLDKDHGNRGCTAPLEMTHSSRSCPCRLTRQQVTTVTAPQPSAVDHA